MTPAEYAQMHKKAFRTAFNFLNTHFPPQQDDEWWLTAAKDCSDASVAAGEDRLVMELLIAVMDYIEYERKKRSDNGGGIEG